jgi:hypothetical protein
LLLTLAGDTRRNLGFQFGPVQWADVTCRDGKDGACATA